MIQFLIKISYSLTFCGEIRVYVSIFSVKLYSLWPSSYLYTSLFPVLTFLLLFFESRAKKKKKVFNKTWPNKMVGSRRKN